jgi:uncharacterized protein (TIGR02145 family)
MMLNKTFHLILLFLIPIFGFSQEKNSQYPDSGNKIRLGFQTTGDGLIWRDTQPKVGVYQPINNKAAWIVLDTVNNKFYHYKNSAWTLAGGQDIDTANIIATKYDLGLKLTTTDTGNMLLPYWRSGKFSGVLPVANGGTGQTTLSAAEINTGTGTINFLPKYTATGTTFGNSNASDDGTTFNVNLQGKFTGLSGSRILTLNAPTNGGSLTFEASGTAFADMGSYPSIIGGGSATDFVFNTRANSSLTLSTAFEPRITILSGGDVGIGTTSPTAKLHVKGSGVTSGTSALKVDDSGGTNLLSVKNNGNVGIGANGSAGYKLDVNGTGRFTSNLLAQKVQVGTASTINDATGVNNTLQFANYSVGVFVTASADSYIYKTSSVFGGLSAQTLIFQTRSDVAGGGFAFVAGTTPSAIATISNTGAATFSSSVTANSLTLTTPLAVANGGTGSTTPTAALNALLPTQSQSTTIGATLKSNGTNTYWDNFSSAGTVQDQSGNFYNTVAIGTQVWFKENLRTKKYRSGALIPVKTNTDTSTLVGQMYYYSNDSLTNYSIYGALYNWIAVNSSDSLCPVGWHVPTDAEWTTLTDYLSINKGGKLKATTTTYWNSPNTDATNETGFSALPGGYREYDGSFYYISVFAFFWSASEYASINALYRNLSRSNGNVNRDYLNKSFGASVRCLKN